MIIILDYSLPLGCCSRLDWLQQSGVITPSSSPRLDPLTHSAPGLWLARRKHRTKEHRTTLRLNIIIICDTAAFCPGILLLPPPTRTLVSDCALCKDFKRITQNLNYCRVVICINVIINEILFTHKFIISRYLITENGSIHEYVHFKQGIGKNCFSS